MDRKTIASVILGDIKRKGYRSTHGWTDEVLLEEIVCVLEGFVWLSLDVPEKVIDILVQDNYIKRYVSV